MKKILNENFFVLTILVNILFVVITLGLISFSTDPGKSSISPYSADYQTFQLKPQPLRYPSSLEEREHLLAKNRVKAEAIEAEILKAKIERLNKLKVSLENSIRNPSPIPPFTVNEEHDPQ